MLRKHYEAFAKMFRESGTQTTAEILIEKMIDILKADNPRFDAEKFRKACGD
jgi:hypothetical protein